MTKYHTFAVQNSCCFLSAGNRFPLHIKFIFQLRTLLKLRVSISLTISNITFPRFFIAQSILLCPHNLLHWFDEYGISYQIECSEAEYAEIVVLPAWTGGLGWSREEYGYLCKVLKAQRYEFKSI